MLGWYLRRGQQPPPVVILCAIAEAEALGRSDLAADITNTFITPAMHQQHQGIANTCFPPAMHQHQGTVNTFATPPVYQQPQQPQAQGAYGYGTEACMQQQPPGEPPRPPTIVSPQGMPPQVEPPQVAPRPPTEDEIFAMLHTDPKAFVDVVTAQPQRRGPLVELFPIGTPRPDTSAAMPPSPAAAPVPPAAPSAPAPTTPTLSEQLSPLPGFMGVGIVRVDPASGSEALEVRWARGYEIPRLPQMVEGRPVCLVIVEGLPTAPMPSEAVAQMQEAAGFYEAADQTRALGPGSPLPGVADESWRQFVALLARESPAFSSSRHVGQYRQRRERLAEFGVDPQAIQGSAAAQRQALDLDLTDAHHHASAGGVLAQHIGRPIVIPGHAGAPVITLSGVLGVIQCAGLDGAVSWLESSNDRKRYPHTTQAFIRTNGVF